MSLKDNKEFVELRDYWYSKLKKRGFNDIENPQGLLIEHHALRYNQVDTGDWVAHQRYYELAGQLLHSHKFVNGLERTVWEHHCAGKSTQSIAKLVKKSKNTVFRIIADLQEYIKQ